MILSRLTLDAVRSSGKFVLSTVILPGFTCVGHESKTSPSSDFFWDESTIASYMESTEDQKSSTYSVYFAIRSTRSTKNKLEDRKKHAITALNVHCTYIEFLINEIRNDYLIKKSITPYFTRYNQIH